VLKWHRCGQEALYTLKSLLCRCPIQCFGVAPQEICKRPQNAGATRKKKAVKVYHAKKMLQVVDILRIGTGVDRGRSESIAAVCAAVGAEPTAEIVWT
jgi:hypothetical protein